MCKQISENCSCKIIIKVVFVIVVIVQISSLHRFFHRNFKSCLAFLYISSVSGLLIILITVDLLIIFTLVPTVFLQLVFIIIKLDSLIILKAWIAGFQLVLREVFFHLLFVFL